MWWKIAVDAANGMLQGGVGRATAKANNRISRVNTETSNKTREYKNAAAAATTNLQRWQQSLNNQRTLEAGGQQLESNTTNYLRSTDARSYDDINRAIGDAETLGAQAAAAGVVGAVGGVTDMIDVSTRLRSGIIEEGAKTLQGQASYDNAKRAGMIYSQTVQGLDSSLILDTFDYAIDYAQETPIMSHFANALQGAGKSFGAGGQGWDVMKNFGSDIAAQTKEYRDTFASTGASASLSSASNAKFGFSVPTTSSSDPWYLGSAKLGSTTESSRAVNPYSLWGN